VLIASKGVVFIATSKGDVDIERQDIKEGQNVAEHGGQVGRYVGCHGAIWHLTGPPNGKASPFLSIPMGCKGAQPIT